MKYKVSKENGWWMVRIRQDVGRFHSWRAAMLAISMDLEMFRA